MTCECCEASIADNRWAKIRAHYAGWYFHRDGRAFCPEHRPDYAPPVPE